MITIIDYGVGNIGSIANMLKKAGARSIITSDLGMIASAEKIILCGIGAFDNGMNKLEELGVNDILHEKAIKEKVPVLGICLGMQLFTKGSEEGRKAGLGFINATTKRFQIEDKQLNGQPLRVPHMGWNQVHASKSSSLLDDMYTGPRFYFVHSYHVVLDDKSDELLSAEYGYSFTAGFQKDNIIGVQFHPEKSHKYGFKLLENFSKL
jgi:glutamine amidotransferase